MPQPPYWKRVLATGMQFTRLRRSRQLASDLVAQGQLARDQLGAVVDELVEMSRRRGEELRRIVRSEADRQFGVLGLATKGDLAALERRLRPTPAANKAPAKKKAAARRNAVRKPAAASTATRAR